METREKRVAEVLGVLAVWAVLYLGVVGPVIGGALPGFDRPALSGEGDDGYGGELPDTARGWLFIVLTVPVLVGYVHVRPRVTGDDPRAYWNEPFQDGG